MAATWEIVFLGDSLRDIADVVLGAHNKQMVIIDGPGHIQRFAESSDAAAADASSCPEENRGPAARACRGTGLE